jgi:hypothetical protein
MLKVALKIVEAISKDTLALIVIALEGIFALERSEEKVDA